MSTIRKQSIISSVIIYFGFAVGLLNTYFFAKEGVFKAEEYGLTMVFVAIATTMMAFASMAMPSYMLKFYPYYKDHLPDRKNDMLTVALVVSTIGFVLVLVVGLLLKHVIIRKFSENSLLLVNYYYWIFVLGFGFTIFNILEAYAWNLHKSVLTNFLKEAQWRLFTTLLIVLFITGIVKDFDLFIKLYSFTYPAIALILLLYLLLTKKVYFTFSLSKVSRRYFKKIVNLCTFVYSGVVIFTVSQVFDTLVIASVLGLKKAGIFGLAQYMTSVIQAPQRGVVAASVGHLSRAWKDRDMALLQRIYQRSSINLLIFAAAIYILIVLNYTEAIRTFGLKDEFLLGFNVFILLGMTRIIDMGTGVNAQIIATSTFWRFEFFSGIVLLLLMLPLTYLLTKQFDIFGPAIANMVSISVYNIIRIAFLWRKFKLQPFTIQSLYTVILAGVGFTICYYLFMGMHGFLGLVLRSAAFIIVYAAGVFYFKLSPDVIPVWHTIQKRLGLKAKDN